MECSARACRACLASDARLVALTDALLEAYRCISGDQVHRLDGLPQQLCFECAARVRGCSAFRARCERGRRALLHVLAVSHRITDANIKTVNRNAVNLSSSIQITQNCNIVNVVYHEIKSEQDISTYRDNGDGTYDSLNNFSHDNTGHNNFDNTDRSVFDNARNSNLARTERSAIGNTDRSVFDNTRHPNFGYTERSAIGNANHEIFNDAIDTVLDVIKEEWCASPDNSIKSGADVKSDDDEPLARRTKQEEGRKKEEKREKKKKKHRKERDKKSVKPDENAKQVEQKKARGRKTFSEEFATVITLSREEQLEELRKRQNSLNYTNSPYKCDKCFKGFVDDSAYGNHMVRHEASSGEYICDVCEVHCRTQRKLKSHAVAAHARKYACRACHHVSNTSNQAREHDKWHKGHTYECKLCGESFRKSTTHLTHVRLRHPTEFVCDVCGDSFVGKHGLAVHKKRTHKDTQEKEDHSSVYCEACDVLFSTEEAWKRHTVTSARHTRTNDFGNGCRVCGEVLESKAELAAHMVTHAKKSRIKRNGCRVCGEVLESKTELAAHTLTHTKKSPVPCADARPWVKCDQCEATFASTRKCLAHFKRMHLGMKYPIKKNVVCEVCGKKCTSNATLAYHQRTHTGEKPFQCSECPKRFSIRQRLQIHERTHTGERPYPCGSCHKAFRHKPALNRHSRVHTGAKPYECNYCGKTFSQSNSMKLHVHTVHLKLPPPYRSKGGQKAAPAVT